MTGKAIPISSMSVKEQRERRAQGRSNHHGKSKICCHAFRRTGRTGSSEPHHGVQAVRLHQGKNPEDYEELLRLGSKDVAVREFLESIHENGDVLFEKEIPFPNGSYAEIMVFAPISIEDSAGAAVILYAVEHNEFNHITDSCLDRRCTSPKTPARYQLNHITDSRLDRLWKMDDRYGNTYIIDVREQEREIVDTPHA